MGNGDSIQCAGSCGDVPLNLSGELFKIPFFILPIHGTDVVHGVQWLQTLGKFMSDYTVPMIQFTHNYKTLTLTGNNTNIPAPASLPQFSQFLFTDSIETIHAVSFNQLDTPTNQHTAFAPTNLEPSLASLLNQYATIFSIPQSLPPPRLQDHHIHLIPSSQPINVQPYRYPQCHKDGMTSMIQDMLKEGIIKPSTSPFSSPVILVKKNMVHGVFVWIIRP